MNVRDGISARNVEMETTTKMKKRQSFCRAKLLPHSWHAANTPSPQPQRRLHVWSSRLLGDTNTNPSLWDVGCGAPKPRFFYSHITPLQTEQITVIWEHWSRQIRLSSFPTFTHKIWEKGVKNTSVRRLNTLQSTHTHAHIFFGHLRTPKNSELVPNVKSSDGSLYQQLSKERRE